uniref:Uncharacterized protein n=1 Tax=Phakopsora pachyrhizi TaxID=170000 RepID=A0A0S1MKG3_PHAPC
MIARISAFLVAQLPLQLCFQSSSHSSSSCGLYPIPAQPLPRAFSCAPLEV